MEQNNERRKEQRLRYHWPIWFAENFHEVLSQGQMIDISSTAAAFTCHADEHCPSPGQHVTTRFSVPRFGEDDSFDMTNLTCSGRIYRVDNVNNYVRRVVIQFVKPLPFKPGEQIEDQSAQENLGALTV